MTAVLHPNETHMNGDANGDYEMGNATTYSSSLRFSGGLILPPPEIKGM